MSFECHDQVVLESNLSPLPLLARGKVRDVYNLGETLLFLATDRISAFDCILGSGIPCKGRVLTQTSLFWFDYLSDLVPNHVLTADVTAYPQSLSQHVHLLQGRSMLVTKAKMIQVECVARGYLSGSGWKEYQSSGTVCGIRLPAGLRQSDRLPEPIFTPATKAQSGHDENVSFEVVANQVGKELATRLRDLTLSIYSRAADYALKHGLILADTKFEFGFIGDQLVSGRRSADSRFLRATGRQLPTFPAARRSPSINNMCGTTWKRWIGTSNRPRPASPTKWSRRRARNIWKRITF